jgi:hypothetical protein
MRPPCFVFVESTLRTCGPHLFYLVSIILNVNNNSTIRTIIIVVIVIIRLIILMLIILYFTIILIVRWIRSGLRGNANKTITSANNNLTTTNQNKNNADNK